MTFNQLMEICLGLPHTEDTFPFDKDTMVFKVKGKMFALTSLSDWENENPSVNLKCDPDKALELREQYDAVKPGYHMSKIHWNTVHINQDVNDKLLTSMIKDSYQLVWNSLPKKDRLD